MWQIATFAKSKAAGCYKKVKINQSMVKVEVQKAQTFKGKQLKWKWQGFRFLFTRQQTTCLNIIHQAEHQKILVQEAVSVRWGKKGLIFFRILSFTQTLHHSEIWVQVDIVQIKSVCKPSQFVWPSPQKQDMIRNNPDKIREVLKDVDGNFRAKF